MHVLSHHAGQLDRFHAAVDTAIGKLAILANTPIAEDRTWQTNKS
jgi:hypothetical protein